MLLGCWFVCNVPATTENYTYTQSLSLHDALPIAGLQPGQVRFHLLGDRSINAFVAGSQDIYVFSGLIEAADTAEEVQGVLAHELGHVMGGHAIRVNDGAKAATNISLLSLLLGAAAIAAGAGEAGMGVKIGRAHV